MCHYTGALKHLVLGGELEMEKAEAVKLGCENKDYMETFRHKKTHSAG